MLRVGAGRASTVAIVFIAFALRVVNLAGESLWRDEVDSIRFAFEPLATLIGNFTAVGFNGPLYHLWLRVWLSGAGVNDFALRYFSAVCGVVLVALIYALGRRMFGAPAGRAAMWLAAISPVMVWYAGEGKMYALQPMLLTLALYALVRAAASRPPAAGAWATFVVAAGLSFYVHLLSPLFIAVALAFCAALWPKLRKHRRAALIAFGALALPYVPLLLWQAPTFWRGGDIGHRFYPLDHIFAALAANWTLGLDARAPLLNLPAPESLVLIARWSVLALVLTLIAYGLIAPLQPSDSTGAALQPAVLTWLIAPTLLVFAVSLRMPIFQPRYVLWSAPALYLLMGLGMARLAGAGKAGRFAWATALLVVSGVSLSGWASQIVNPIRPDLRGAVAYVVAAMRPDDVVVLHIPYYRHSFVYYADQLGRPADPARLIEAPFTNHGMAEDELDCIMRDRLSSVAQGAARVWLFESEAAMWDARGLVRRWMDQHLVLEARYELRGVQVRLYGQPRSSARTPVVEATTRGQLPVASCKAAALGMTYRAITQAVPSAPLA